MYDTPGLSPRHLALFVVGPTLATLAGGDARNIDNPVAVELLVGTAAQESGLRALDQITGRDDRTLGPAYGLWQIEPATEDDVWENYLRFRPGLKSRVEALLAPWPSRTMQLATNLAYAAAIARLVYYRSPVKLAPPGDIAGHAATWKAVYNTEHGKGTPDQFIANYKRLVAPYL